MKLRAQDGFAMALCLALTLGACGDRNPLPTGPTPVTPGVPAIPMVGGTYAGTISAWRDEELVGTYAITMTVTQSGARVTADGTIEGDILLMETTNGTIASDGTFTPDDLADDVSEACGRRTDRELELRFTDGSDGSAELKESWQSELCGHSRFESTMDRA